MSQNFENKIGYLEEGVGRERTYITNWFTKRGLMYALLTELLIAIGANAQVSTMKL